MHLKQPPPKQVDYCTPLGAIQNRNQTKGRSLYTLKDFLKFTEYINQEKLTKRNKYC